MEVNRMMTQPSRVSFLFPQTSLRRSISQRNRLMKVSEKSSQGDYRISSLSSSIASDSNQSEFMESSSNDQNINNLPSQLYATYRPIPVGVKVLLVLISTVWSSFSCKLRSTLVLKDILNNFNLTLRLVARFCFSLFLLNASVQDLLFSPSRVDTPTLIQNDWLPSRLSKFTRIQTTIEPAMLGVPDQSLRMQKLGVHYLEYENPNVTDRKFDAIHFSHGFGASSLSWVPVIPSLVKKIDSKKGIAHDSPGFGFTDRNQDLEPFSSAGSAALGLSLLNKILMSDSTSNNNEKDEPKRVALLGHSMGCASSLKMALALPRNVKVDVILVAPALVGDFDEDTDDRKNSIKPALFLKKQPVLVSKFISLIRQVIFDPFLMYVLKRAVGTKNFWRRGLNLVWGDPKVLTPTDILRFQWPGVSKGWERGLLSFSRSRIKAICKYQGGEIKLLRDVIERPNTSVTIIHGTNDKIVPIQMSETIVSKLGKIDLIRMKGYGHDPFEEGENGVNEFCEIVFERLT